MTVNDVNRLFRSEFWDFIQTQDAGYWLAPGGEPRNIGWLNIPFNPDIAGRLGFLNFNVLHSSGDNAALGSIVHRRFGLAMIQSMQPAKKELNDDLTERLLRWLELLEIEMITIFEQSATDIGREGKYYQTNISAGFHYDT